MVNFFSPNNDKLDLIDEISSMSFSTRTIFSIPLDNASIDRMPLPAKRSRDDLHLSILITLNKLSLMTALVGLRLALFEILIILDLYLPDIIFNLLFNSFSY